MMSDENPGLPPKRAYTLRARARRREEVHFRITKAAVHLHGTVGPARTTMSDIARNAGVRRATVYNHFPTDLELFDACSSHWFSENPPPDPDPWLAIPDPRHRAETALCGMYAYYERGREMLENVLRDAPLVPALAKTVQGKWGPLLDRIVEILADGWSSTEDGKHALLASLRVALDFFTWQTLAASGFSNQKAARLAAAWVEAGRAFPP